MTWTEHNGPRVGSPVQRGFGSTVIGPMAQFGLNADVQLDFAPGGLRWQIDCPAAKVIAGNGGDAVLETHSPLEAF
jgi:hypothetical protein